MSVSVSPFLAFAAGLFSFVSRCVLPLVPAYVGYLGSYAAREGETSTSPPERLILTREQAAQIEAHARSEYPLEACGLLGGRNGKVESVYPLPNVEGSSTRYLADPQAQLQAMLEIEDRGWDVVAIYHSHPSSPPYPSDTDLEMAFYPEALYLIVSLVDQRRPVLRAFHIQGRESREVEVSVSD